MYLGREIPVDQKNSTLVLSLDFDGCTDTPESRDRLIDTIHTYCLDHPQYTEIIVVIGSLRQSVLSDLNNAIMNSRHFAGELLSCTILLSEFADRLSAKLNTTEEEKIKVIPEPLLTSDIYNDLVPGTTVHIINQISYQEFIGRHKFKSIPVCDFFGNNVSYFTKERFEEWYNGYIGFLDEDSKSLLLSHWAIGLEEFNGFVEFMDTLHLPLIQVTSKTGRDLVVIEKTGQLSYTEGDLFHFDDTDKTLSLYIIKQYLTLKHAKTFDLLHVDDKVDLLATMECYFSENKHVIPRGSSFRRLEWNSYEMEAKFGTKILGIGDINHDYIKDAKVIADICMQSGCSSAQYMSLYLKAKQPKRVLVSDGGLIRPKPVKPNPLVSFSFFERAAEAVAQEELVSGFVSSSIKSPLTNEP